MNERQRRVCAGADACLRQPDPWVVLDTETTGFGACDEVIEVVIVSGAWGAALFSPLIQPYDPQRPHLSPRFSPALRQAHLKETFAGYIVLTVGCDTKRDAMFGPGPDTLQRLDEVHQRKIDLAGEILVLHIDGDGGAATRSDIEDANQQGKRIRWLVESNQEGDQ